LDNIDQLKISILSFEETNTDLEWVLPLAVEFRFKNSAVNIMLLNNYSYANKSHIVQDAIEYGFNIKYRNQIFRLTNILCNILNIVKIPITHSTIIIKAIERFISYTGLRKMNNYNRILNKSDIVFASNYPGVPTNYMQKYTYNTLKSSSTLFVGVPIVTWPFWYQSGIFPFDLFLVSTNTELKQIKNESIHSNVKFFGCPSLDYNYLLSKRLSKSISDRVKKCALLITINNTNPAFSDWNQFEETKNISSILVELGYKVLIKIHPRSDDQFRQSLIRLADEYITIADESIERAVTKCSLVVSYLSTAVFKAVARKVPTLLYVPDNLTYNERFKTDNVAKRFYFSKYEENETRIDKYCLKVKDLTELRNTINSKSIQNYLEFESTFNPNGAGERTVRYILKNLTS
jgi:hypothetical protein